MSNKREIVHSENYYNFYKPMIDYLDSQTQYPHLPYSKERGLRVYRAKNSVKPIYTSEDIEKYTEVTSEQAKKDLDDFLVCNRLEFSVIKTDDAAILVKNLQGETVSEKLARKDRERAVIEREERKKELQEERRKKLKKMLEESRSQEFARNLEKAIRGKSSNKICDAVLAESRKRDHQHFMQLHN